jgi:diguanylate cyclase (GGDEF)-like protein
MAALQQATQMAISSKDTTAVLQQLLFTLRNHLGVERSAVFLLDGGERLTLRAQHGFDSNAVHPADLTQEPKLQMALNARVAQRLTLASGGSQIEHLATPLIVRDRALGVLLAALPSPITNEDLTLMSLLVTQAATMVENFRLHDAERVRLRQVEFLRLVARSAATSADGTQLYPTVAELLGDSFEDAEVTIVLCASNEDLTLAGFAGQLNPSVERFLQSRQKGLLGQALKQKSAALVSDKSAADAPLSCYPPPGSEICVPLVSDQGTLGALVVARPAPGGFDKEMISLAQAAAEVTASAVRGLRLHAQLQRLADTDSLTGCYNHRHFHTILAQEYSRSRRYQKPFGLLLLDLRRLGEVNTVLGIDEGDKVLQQVASSLRSRLRTHDTLARYGGDRFAVLLPESDTEGVTSVLSKLVAGLSQVQTRFPGAPRAVSAHWAAVHFPEDNANDSELMRLLFSRMESAKQQAPANEP